jgi:hypothetical protein
LAELAGENTGMTTMRAILLVICPQTARPPLRSKVKPVVKATIPLLDSRGPSAGQAHADLPRTIHAYPQRCVHASLAGTEI